MTVPVGVWLAAGAVHGHPVYVGEPYPHICQHVIPGHGPRWSRQIGPKGCIACAENGSRNGEETAIPAPPETNKQAVDRAEENHG